MIQEQGDLLLKIAREAIEVSLGSAHAGPYPETWLKVPGASFVTLTHHGDLRGCIGSLAAHRPLGDDVQENARAAAFRDPRFPPVARTEFGSLVVEVSVLSPLTPLIFENEEAALGQLRPGTDGLVLESGLNRGTFLPQVWDQLPDPRLFLNHLKTKAGLPRDFWGPHIRLYRYVVEKWTERPKP